MDDVEAVARALCRVDGHDPDLLELASLTSGNATKVPTWHRYRREARRFVAASSAMSRDRGGSPSGAASG